MFEDEDTLYMKDLQAHVGLSIFGVGAHRQRPH